MALPAGEEEGSIHNLYLPGGLTTNGKLLLS